METTKEYPLDSILPDFAIDLSSIHEAQNAIGGKWSLKLIVALAKGHKRFNEIKEYIGNISPRALSKELKVLERNGLITKGACRERPIYTEYQLTAIAYELKGVIEEISNWGRCFRARKLNQLNK
ncbi:MULTISPECIES: winged helix-turn-helix transcriptional regulator [Olivibacter]|jgi:DNA-binding HxlR family transcriptional regulator|uniref:Transcriptional regulator, HxlR family n=3 Tax=Sphingobacteriaceae TaxID=84566 RepID=F4C688_SPHS2|nr:MULTISPECIES: helix-turn-helix domain-containing protein [Olivibacter]MCL4641557.1 helix-turn-helix transcriptional regulator [Olivibacter sp. UJ_SKK_5.1]MDM8173343.1 helix-turn-helix domain-containing protein [Olivibacter sp. 47]MDX3915220.1 helix-turn-helix domain-containing protein [Pseudosphingobacterium sp.]QEL03118.1 helix-turn-helix transcriptional regulator [Olivibacter sp. LS-1]